MVTLYLSDDSLLLYQRGGYLVPSFALLTKKDYNLSAHLCYKFYFCSSLKANQINVLMKIFTLSLLFAFSFSCFTSAQEVNPKIARYVDKVNVAQQRVEDAEALIFSADSLTAEGEKLAAQAEEDLKVLAQERRDIERDYFNAKKPVERQLRSKDKEDVKQAKAQMREVENDYKAAIREWNTRYRVLVKEYDAGGRLIEKGKANLKKAKSRKKDLEKKLKVAEKNLAKAKKEYEKKE